MKTKIEQGNAPGWTPGPWMASHRSTQDGKGGTKRFHILAAPDQSIEVCVLKGWDDEDEQNARLIAAAPEMAEALREVTRCLSEYSQTGYMHGWDKPLAEARAMLARIGGAS